MNYGVESGYFYIERVVMLDETNQNLICDFLIVKNTWLTGQ